MIVGLENFRAKTRGLRGAEDAPESVPEDLGFGGSRREKRRKKQRRRRRAASAPPPSRPRGISALSRALTARQAPH